VSEHRDIVAECQQFVGKRLIDVYNEIQVLAGDIKPKSGNRHHEINVMDPVFNTTNITRQPDRLDVHVDENYIIESFEVG
jgi:hypothetical protein